LDARPSAKTAWDASADVLPDAAEGAARLAQALPDAGVGKLAAPAQAARAQDEAFRLLLAPLALPDVAVEPCIRDVAPSAAQSCAALESAVQPAPGARPSAPVRESAARQTRKLKAEQELAVRSQPEAAPDEPARPVLPREFPRRACPPKEPPQAAEEL